MAITPQDIEQQTFSPSKHGYDTEEVDAFLETISSEIEAYIAKIGDLKGRLNAAEEELAAANARAAELEAAGSGVVGAETVYAAPAADYSATERQISQALIVAQQSADKLVEEAKENAERIRNEADAKAREVIRQALAEKQNELDEIDRLKQSREDFRVEYKSLLQHFMDDADAVFPQQGLITPNGSAARAAAPVASPMPVISASAPAPVPAPAADVDDAGDFGDLD